MKHLIIAVLSSMFALSAHSAPATPEELKAVLGHYIGGEGNWSNVPSSKITCSVDISVNAEGKVVVKLTNVDGIPFYSRKSNSERRFDVKVLQEVSHPALKVRDFLKKSNSYSGEISHYLSKKTLKTSESWSLRLAHLNTTYGFVQMSYEKTANFEIYDSTLAYTADLTGCYNLQKQ